MQTLMSLGRADVRQTLREVRRSPGLAVASVATPALRTVTVSTALFVLSALAGCRRKEHPPAPTFAELFPPVGGPLMTESSPSLADLDGDGVPDIVFGTGIDRVRPIGRNLQFTGEPVVSGEVVAVSGATNRVLWEVPNPRDAFTTPRFVRLNGDRVPDVVMGGREGILTAYDGPTGNVIWRLNGDDVVHTSFPYYFMTPAVIQDVNGDGVADLIDGYGGNDTKNPGVPRDPGYLMIVSGADGKVLKMAPMPDGAETYASPVVYHRRDGSAWVVFGSGGESLGGAEYRAPIASVLDGTFLAKVERLVPAGKKGVIAPATILDINHDGEPDIVVSTFDGRLVAIDGASGKPLWQHTDDNEESYHSAAVVRLGEGHVGLFVSRGTGAFPRYVGTVHRLYDAVDGRVLYEFRDPNRPGGAPLAVDLTGDGVDEVFFFAISFPAGQASRFYVIDFVSHALISHDVQANLWSTPAVADVRGKGSLELIALTWLAGKQGGSMARPDAAWRLVRLDLSAKTPPSLTWSGYMGTAHDGLFRER